MELILHSFSKREHISLDLPPKIRFGVGTSGLLTDDISSLDKCKAFIVLSGSVQENIQSTLDALNEEIAVQLWTKIDREPTVSMFEECLLAAREFKPDIVIGIGGGSILDVAKLIAALANNNQKVGEIYGSGKLAAREIHLVCLPTTSGTGSEVSPNSILLDEEEDLKKGIISPFLIPDVTYIDPELTTTLSPKITAATGLDALTHCIEAYTNRFAHQMIDLYALEGIRLIGENLERALENGNDIEARTNMSLASMYGGLCLGPVNTAAVHALSYPLGSEYHISHGISNAVLLPHVMEFNLEAVPGRYARIAEALGVEKEASDDVDKARAGVEKIKKLMKSCNVPTRMSQMDIPKDAIGEMAKSAMSITRLLKNNPRKLTVEEAKKIYIAAF